MNRNPDPLAGQWRPGLAGAVAIDKPAGCTSHDVVARARRVLGERRIGHGGTLDPGATGVLVLGIGAATRLLRFASELSKSYSGEVVLGTETTTLDDSGEVTAEHDMSLVTLEEVVAAARSLTGPIAQVPPMVSAVHVGGRRLHELARQGITVEREPRRVEVYRFDVAPGRAPGCFAIEVECSSGTYVRSLAADLGRALGGGAHLRSLRRLAVGSLGGDGLVPLDALGPPHVAGPELLVAHLGRVEVGPELQLEVSHGSVLERARLGLGGSASGGGTLRESSGDGSGGEGGTAPDPRRTGEGEGPWAVFSCSGSLLAVYEAYGGGRLKPVLVLAQPGPASGDRSATSSTRAAGSTE